MTGIPGGAVGYGLKAVEGAAARGGSDGRDVVGGGCTPLSARATATNNHPWSIHGGFIRQVPTVFICCSHCFPRFSFSNCENFPRDRSILLLLLASWEDLRTDVLFRSTEKTHG